MEYFPYAFEASGRNPKEAYSRPAVGNSWGPSRDKDLLFVFCGNRTVSLRSLDPMINPALDSW